MGHSLLGQEGIVLQNPSSRSQEPRRPGPRLVVGLRKGSGQPQVQARSGQSTPHLARHLIATVSVLRRSLEISAGGHSWSRPATPIGATIRSKRWRAEPECPGSSEWTTGRSSSATCIGITGTMLYPYCRRLQGGGQSVTTMPAKKKTGKASLTRSTAGAGFDFEDHVAAWLLLKVLTGQPLPGIEGSGTRLQMQVEPLGWVIDDILLTGVVSANDQRRIAISCKSNQQVTGSGLPADFVAQCWRQWSKTDENPMTPRKDKLMLATRGRHNAFMATWTDLKDAACSSDSELALRRMTATAKHRKVFQSVKGPANDAGANPSDADVVEMINTMEIMPVDFQMVGSEYEGAAIAASRSLLVNNSLSEGNVLWQELLTQAKNARLGSGTIKVFDLWHTLRRTFRLKDYPDHESSWQKLRALTEDYQRTIETEFVSGRAVKRETESFHRDTVNSGH